MAEKPKDLTREEKLDLMQERLDKAAAKNKPTIRQAIPSVALDIGGPDQKPDGKITKGDDLKAMDANKDGKITKEEAMKAMGADKMGKDVKGTLDKFLDNVMKDKKEGGMAVDELAQALADAGVSVDGVAGSKPPAKAAPKSKGTKGR
ncbi:MAG: hypothetical protein EBV03_11010 [Proteobacteria bacterium]|nr:hypothetical protein [Pseudomonadota bacterium]